MVLDIIDNGADIGFNGPRYPRFTKNSATAREFSEVLLKSITKEVASGHSVGPFFSPPFPNFVVSSLGVREKKTGGHRIIMDLSRPFGDSVNDHISPEDYSLAFCSVDDACNMLQTVGKGALMAKEDVKAAFRLIPVRPLDWPLLGYMVSGSYYFDVVLPFGCRSSPFLFCLFSYAVHWILEHHTQHHNILHYVDDFLIIGRTECPHVVSEMRRLCHELGVPLATEKAEGPSTSLTFLGIQLDSVAQTLSLPQSKTDEIMALSVLQLYTDASATLGMGGYFNGQWFQSRWPTWVIEKAPCIEYLEMLPILIALLVWGKSFHRKRLVFHCDNLGAVFAWEKLGSSNSAVLDLMRRMTTIAAENNFTLTIKHISGVNNNIADALSRFQRDSTNGRHIPGPRTERTRGIAADLRPLVSLKYQREVNDLLHHHIGASTRATYSAAVRQFTLFCQSHAHDHYRWYPNVILQYIGFLHTKQISYSTAKVYLSGINNNFVEQGQESFLKHPDIARSLQGFKRLHPTPKDRRLPITLTTLRHMKQRLTSEPLISPLDKALFWSACTLAYSGYLRASEFTARRGPASHTLQFRDVKVKQQSISLLLRTSKTDQYAKGNKIRIPATGRFVCPVAAIREYLQLRPDTETQDGPFFVRLRSAPLTRSFFASTLKSCLSGFPNASRYSTHSFRIGAATEASRQGLNPDEIRQAGRWKSTCYAGYIRKKSYATELNIYSNLLN
ncbi:hypothetical protein RvY_16396 [Ramazzottius varieornatus]|uniref:Reverse transcriptase domain-containing protein n=1 Tax=Ramazzottius varieornatus TaxID=947166 RepID=A0A1D1W5V8_RAMVA|nr:hypothetical protein RvY_16396 [Ramazzottius varieornatus]